MTDFDEFGLIRKLSKNCTPAKCNSIYFKSTIYERERGEDWGRGSLWGREFTKSYKPSNTDTKCRKIVIYRIKGRPYINFPEMHLVWEGLSVGGRGWYV